MKTSNVPGDLANISAKFRSLTKVRYDVTSRAGSVTKVVIFGGIFYCFVFGILSSYKCIF